MKKKQIATVLMLAATLMLTCAATANCQAEDARVLLMHCCQQEGVDVRSEAVFLDEEGRVWQYQSDEPLPDTDAERLAFLSACQDATLIRQLDANRVFEMESLIAAAGEPQMEQPTDISDGGLDTYTAVRYGRDGAAEFIPLAAMGERIMENREPNAYALYIACFMEVMGYELEAELDTLMKPSISRIPLVEFLGLDAGVFEGATLTASRLDCEAGSIDLALDEQQAQQKLAWLSNLVVTQKQNALNVTGDTEVYTLHSSEGDFLANFAFYNGLLVTDDGMYVVECD